MAKHTAPAAPATATAAPAAPATPAVPGGTVVRSRNNRQSGTRINMATPAAAGQPWVVTCMAHNSTVTAPSRKLAKPHVYTPAAWCSGCAAIVAARLAAAKAAVAAGTAAVATTPAAK